MSGYRHQGEDLPAGVHLPIADYDVMNTPAELTATQLDGRLAVTLDPPAVYVRDNGRWVPLASVEGNVPAPTVVNASEDAAGIAEVASQEETNTGADASRIVTPARLAGRTATEARSGLVELATLAEALAGTDAARAVTPAALKAALTPEGWVSPTLLNGWVSFGASLETAGYHRDPLGYVHLKGVVKNGSGTVPIFRLPAGYRPAAEKVFAAKTDSTNSGRVDVEPDGDVVLQLGTNGYLSLAGISFRAEL